MTCWSDIRKKKLHIKIFAERNQKHSHIIQQIQKRLRIKRENIINRNQSFYKMNIKIITKLII